jgi:3-hydroxyacyl-[acyl-carrier-protein] dehydratase
MRFTLIDRIVELEPGRRIMAVKALSLAEEYLADHFPKFPVLPGVLMLEAMTQAAAWLVRASEDFSHSMVVLKQASNIKYGHFVKPGQILTVTAEILSQTEQETKLKAQGKVEDRMTVGARLVLERFNLATSNPGRAFTDDIVKREMRSLFDLLWQPQGAGASGAGQRSAASEAPLNHEQRSASSST